MVTSHKGTWSFNTPGLCAWLEYLQLRSWLRSEWLRSGKRQNASKTEPAPRNQAEYKNTCCQTLNNGSLGSSASAFPEGCQLPKDKYHAKANVSEGEDVKRCSIPRASHLRQGCLGHRDFLFLPGQNGSAKISLRIGISPLPGKLAFARTASFSFLQGGESKEAPALPAPWKKTTGLAGLSAGSQLSSVQTLLFLLSFTQGKAALQFTQPLPSPALIISLKFLKDILSSSQDSSPFGTLEHWVLS